MKVVGAVSVMKVWVPLYMRGERSTRDYNTFEYIKEILWTCTIQSESGQMSLMAKDWLKLAVSQVEEKN